TWSRLLQTTATVSAREASYAQKTVSRPRAVTVAFAERYLLSSSLTSSGSSAFRTFGNQQKLKQLGQSFSWARTCMRQVGHRSFGAIETNEKSVAYQFAW